MNRTYINTGHLKDTSKEVSSRHIPATNMEAEKTANGTPVKNARNAGNGYDDAKTTEVWYTRSFTLNK
jgi:hypothetical protein